jgi:hypothetical protein
MKTVIYHSADFDGVFCREIARKFLGDKDVQFIGWNFGDPKIPFPTEGKVFVLDLSPECFDAGAALIENARLVWIDHHKTSIQKWSAQIPGYRIDGVAACRLAWQWFSGCAGHPNYGNPDKAAFVERRVIEPLAVRLAGEYDIWDHRGDGDLEFQYGLRCRNEPPFCLMLESSERGRAMTNEVIADGQSAMAYSANVDADLVLHRSFRLKWEGLDFLCLNTGRFNSLTFAALDKPETGHDALLGFMWNGKVWTVSLYHAAHRKDIDLSVIAVKHGGGGHKGACGFTCTELPWNMKPRV